VVGRNRLQQVRVRISVGVVKKWPFLVATATVGDGPGLLGLRLSSGNDWEGG
jgi:hypothetical protein